MMTMTETMTERKQVRYLQPGERLHSKDATGTYLVTEVRKLGAGIYEVTTDQGSWMVDGGREVVVETTPELDPFAGLDDAPAEPVRAVDRATDKQVDFIVKLHEERGLPTNREEVARFTKRTASAEIDRLLKTPPVTTSGEELPEVPEGRYAIDKADGSGVVFYQVDRPTEGRWAGYTFVKLLIGAPGDWRRERVRDYRKVLERIAEAGPREAAIRFGLESGYCGRCGSPLSNEESLKRGIGPVCATKAGW